jgi:hypothetical protein
MARCVQARRHRLTLACAGVQEQAAIMEELRSWQALVSLWDRMKDRRLHMHEAPSTFEIDRPAREGWLMRRSKSAGVFAEWRRQWAVLKRAHLFLYDRPDSSRPSNWYLLRKVRWETRDPGVACVRAPVRVCVSACLCTRPSKWVKVRAHTHTSNRDMQ